MRLIDGDELMEILTTAIRNMKGMAKFLSAEDDPEIQMEIKAYTDIANGVRDMQTIKPGLKWIPCSERLPEVHETGNSFSGVYMQSYPVLVYGVPEDEEEYGFHVVTYCDDLNGYTYWSTELDAVTIDGVKAWMPLPEPYKEGEG